MPLREKVERSIKLLRLYSPGVGLYGDSGYLLAFSGGKDSTVIAALAQMAEVPYRKVYSVTGVDPPELTRFIRTYHPDTVFRKPEQSMRDLIVHYGCPPLRTMRYCCRVLKESARSLAVCTGIRREESINRAKRRETESCYRSKASYYVHPILEWTSDDVWEFIRAEGLPYCSLYDEPDITRIGCVMCPYAGPKGMKREAERWPGIARGYLLACREAYAKLVERDEFEITWKSGDDMFDWWMRGAKGQRRVKKTLKKQLEIDLGLTSEQLASVFE